MEKIFDNTALNLLPLPNGFIVAFCKSDEEPQGKMVVAYNLVSFEKETVSSVTRSVYQLAKFGKNYKEIEQKLNAPFYWKTIFLPSENIFCYYPDGNAKIIDEAGNIKWEGTVTYGNCGASDFALHSGNLWATFPEKNCIARINLRTMKEELRIGGESSAFGSPESLFLDGDNLYVCDSASQVVWRVNTLNYSVSEYLSFEEPVYQFMIIGDTQIARLESGVYRI